MVERVKRMFKTLKRIITDTKRFEPFKRIAVSVRFHVRGHIYAYHIILYTTKETETLRSTVPWKTLTQPSGMPASCASFIINIIAKGFLGEGFMTMVLPHTNAIGNICRKNREKDLLLLAP